MLVDSDDCRVGRCHPVEVAGLVRERTDSVEETAQRPTLDHGSKYLKLVF